MTKRIKKPMPAYTIRFELDADGIPVVTKASVEVFLSNKNGDLEIIKSGRGKAVLKRATKLLQTSRTYAGRSIIGLGDAY